MKNNFRQGGTDGELNNEQKRNTMRKAFAVIASSAVNMKTGLRKLVGKELVGKDIFDKVNFVLMIEVSVWPNGGYIPVNEAIRAMFPNIEQAYVDHLVIQY
ncbi:MAG: hypothetical protein NT155_02020 [Candidatus Staskawiczbacteria bacterium]|nr:hypothetical protein [Candidatus Staskawiczbacteria bacterium]